MEARNEQERRTLVIVLGINAFMFVFELVVGLIAQSTGLIADSLDMFADASVYLLSLYAVGKSAAVQGRAAKLSGSFQVLLALLVLGDVLRRFIYGSEPASGLMIGMGLIALVANSTCLSLIAKHRDGGIHMRASFIFSQVDVVANVGVIVSGALVWVLGSRYPDLLIGLAIAAVVLRGGIRILKEAAEHKPALPAGRVAKADGTPSLAGNRCSSAARAAGRAERGIRSRKPGRPIAKRDSSARIEDQADFGF